MPEEVLTLCDVLEHELVSIAMETDFAETDHQYTDFMNRADSEVDRGTARPTYRCDRSIGMRAKVRRKRTRRSITGWSG